VLLSTPHEGICQTCSTQQCRLRHIQTEHLGGE
jgi:hypothetical protein